MGSGKLGQSKLQGLKWKSLTPEEKKPYIEEAHRLMQSFKAQFPNYKEKHNFYLNRNAFNLWSQIERKKISKSPIYKGNQRHPSQITRLLGLRWKSMTPADKKPFIDKALYLAKAENQDNRFLTRGPEKVVEMGQEARVQNILLILSCTTYK